LVPKAEPQEVRDFIAVTPRVLEHLWNLATYVPALFLTPWFAAEMREISAGTARVKASNKTRIRNSVADRLRLPTGSTEKADAFSFESIESWAEFLRENLAMLESFADHHHADYLQARNPNSPGIIRKLRAPSTAS
jgi:hypothetical protein